MKWIEHTSYHFKYGLFQWNVGSDTDGVFTGCLSLAKAMNEVHKTIVLVLPFPIHIHTQYFFPLAFSSAIIKGIHT